MTIQEKLQQMLEVIGRATPGPDGCFSEFVSMCDCNATTLIPHHHGEECRALMAYYYLGPRIAQSRTDWEKTVRALQVATAKLKDGCVCFDGEICSWCKTEKEIEEILCGPVS